MLVHSAFTNVKKTHIVICINALVNAEINMN